MGGGGGGVSIKQADLSNGNRGLMGRIRKFHGQDNQVIHSKFKPKFKPILTNSKTCTDYRNENLNQFCVIQRGGSSIFE